MPATNRFRVGWRISPQLYAWGQREQRLDDSPLPEFLVAGVLDAVTSSYDGVEFSLSILSSEERVQAASRLLNGKRLKLSSLFATLPLNATEAQMDALAGRAKVLLAFDAKILNVATAALGGKREGADFEGSTRVLGYLGKRLRAWGGQLCFHPHEEHLEEDCRGLRAVLQGTAAEDVSVCLDVGWVARAGAVPVRAVELCGQRLGMLHFRDLQSDKVWCQALGDGQLDLNSVLGALQAVNFPGWLVIETWFERDTRVTRSVTENARTSLQALRQGA